MKIIWLLPVFLIAFIAASFAGYRDAGGIFLILAWLDLSLWVRRFSFGKSFSYPLLVGAALTSSMYFPFLYLKAGNLDTMKLIVPILQVIMFGMGTQLKFRDFQQVIRQPWGVVVGMACQFGIMPIVGYTLANLFGFDKEIMVGIILVGSVPGGIASNVMNFIARANVALSITLTAIATLIAPVVTPFLMQTLAGEMIEIRFIEMMLSILDIVIFPIIAGVIFQAVQIAGLWKRSSLFLILGSALFTVIFFLILLLTSQLTPEAFTNRIETILSLFVAGPIVLALILRGWIRENSEKFEKLLGFISMLGLLLTIVIINAAGRDHLLKIGHILILACICHNVIGYILGYSIAKLCRLDEQSCRTISLEVGLQNGGLASGLAVTMGKAATVGLAPAIFGPLMNVTGSCLATWWRGSTPNPTEKKSSDNDSPAGNEAVNDSDIVDADKKQTG
ncbi:MAG: bile acid:sodium symporter family protein [Planctomycetia bacterium]|nr:bile acid:sodium symporter family protein [Planctomycetia bacterium]